MGVIYCAFCKTSRKVYIGKTTKSLQHRMNGHKTVAKRKKSNNYFHNAIRKYGFSDFSWKELFSSDDVEILNKEEETYIELVKLFYKGKIYNMTDGGEGCSGFKHTDEYKQEMKGNTRGKANKGKKLSPETKKKVSDGLKKYFVKKENQKKNSEAQKKAWQKRKNRKPTEKTKKNMSMARKKWWQKWRQQKQNEEMQKKRKQGEINHE